MTIPQTASHDRPAAKAHTPQTTPVRQATSDPRLPILACGDASEPAELAQVVIRGYN